MLVWVASFPRSGSALTRTILWQCFGLHVNTAVPPGGPRIPPGPEAAAAVAADMTPFFGPSLFPDDATEPAILAAADASDGPILLKTHGLPGELSRPEAPAIVIVRDGRPVMTSFARFRSEMTGRDIPVKAVIDGRPKDWSQHVGAWLDHGGPKLVLRYEDLRVARQEAMDAIAGFIGRPQIGEFTATVEEIRAVRPTHIRVARDEPGIEAIERDHAEAFWSRHGETMRRLGYSR